VGAAIVYPKARPDRGAFFGPDTGAAAAPPPQTRVFPFTLAANANTRTSVSSPIMHGPAIIRGLHFSKGGAASGLQGPGLGKSVVAVSENSVAVTTPAPFTKLFEGLDSPSGSAGAADDATAIADMQASLLTDADNLGIVVTDPEWRLVVYVASGAVGAAVIQGYVTVLEGVSPEALANFL
jgi:hypothetical protein